MSTEDKIRGLIADIAIVAVEEVRADDSLIDQLGFDSLDCVELTMGLEESFSIEIPDEEADQCLTVQDVLNLVEKLLGEVNDSRRPVL